MAEKRYYWLKLKTDYFDSPKIKKLRRIAGGDTYTIIYLKMQLLSVSNGGVISFERIEDNFEEELALKLDEQVEDVQLTLAYLKQQGLIEAKDEKYLLVEACNNIGSETSSAERVRRFREKETKALLGNAGVTQVKQNSLSNSIYNIYNYWNSKNIIKHKELNKEKEDSIKNSLKKYSEEKIKTYIDRYNTVIKDESYFFDYKWTLTEFLSRKDGISAFTDEGSKWVSYNQKKTVQKKSNQNFQQREIADDQKYESVYDNIDDVDLT